jgi:sulfonate transport system permease protein
MNMSEWYWSACFLLENNRAMPEPISSYVPVANATRRASYAWLRALSPLLLIVSWQIASSAGFISSRTLAAPSQVAASLGSLIASGELQHHLLISLGRAAKGLAFALVLGGGLALVAGLSKIGEYIIDAPIQMFRTLPVVALVPLFIIWFGIGELPKIALVTVAATFPIYLALYAGIRGVDTKLIELARVLGLSRRALIRHVILPGALPMSLVGLRYSLGISLVILVVAEQVNATSGIGYLISDARDFMRTDVIVVGLLVYAVLGLAVDVLVRWLERRLLSWRPSFVGATT